jgi:feruloyl esterase
MTIRIIGPVLAALSCMSVPALAAPCDQLAALALKDATVTSATLVTAGSFETFKNLPAFCRVAATLKPSSDSDIKVEVWLPATGWNGKVSGRGQWRVGRCDQLQRHG